MGGSYELLNHLPIEALSSVCPMQLLMAKIGSALKSGNSNLGSWLHHSVGSFDFSISAKKMHTISLCFFCWKFLLNLKTLSKLTKTQK